MDEKRNEVRKAHYENMNWAHVAHDAVEAAALIAVLLIVCWAAGWI